MNFLTNDILYTSGDIKREAKAQLSGYWRKAIVLSIIPGIFSIIFLGNAVQDQSLFADVVDIILNAIHTFLLVGVSFTMIDFIRRRDSLSEPLRSVMQAFRSEYFVGLFKLVIYKYLYIILWSLLLIIPGIIKGYAYSQAEFIYKDKIDSSGIQPDPKECLRESEELMRGQKMRLFTLNFSFLGWMILAIFTLGIGLIWLIPYMQISEAIFYENIAGSSFLTDELGDEFSDRVYSSKEEFRQTSAPNEEVGKDPDDFSDFEDF